MKGETAEPEVSVVTMEPGVSEEDVSRQAAQGGESQRVGAV